MKDEPQQPDRRYYPGPITCQAHDSDARVKLCWGPIGTAKTTWLCFRTYYRALEAAEEGKSLRTLFLRDTYRNLADSTLKTWLHWFPDGRAGKLVRSQPADFILKVGGVDHEVLFRHGQTAKDASDVLGTEYGQINLDEVAPAYSPGKTQLVSPGIAEEIFDMVLSRGARARTDVQPELAITANPPPRSHWASTRIIDKSGDEKHGVLSFASGSWEHWFTPISENAANLRSTYYQELIEGWPRILVRRFVEGERVEAFIGVPRFDLDKLDEMRRDYAMEPAFRGYLRESLSNILKVKPEANAHGWIRMFAQPILSHRYVIGADVAEGIEGLAYSAAYVLDCDNNLSIAAAFHGHLGPELYGDELAKLGHVYNSALVGVESNNHGLTTLTCLKNLGYPRIFFQPQIQTRNRKQERLGWQTTSASRPMVIDGIADYLDDGGKIIDAELIGELMTFGIGPDGVPRPQEGCFGDRVIGYGIALQMRNYSGLERIWPALGRRKQEQEAASS